MKIYNITTDSSYVTDNSTFNLLNVVSLNLTGSSDTVILPARADDGTYDAGYLSINGDNNAVIGSATSGINLTLQGCNNVVELGNDTIISDHATGSQITVGANSGVFAGTGSTVNAQAGGGSITFGFSNGTANADNASITVDACSVQVNGNGNSIYEVSDAGITALLDLEGNNNVVNCNPGWWGTDVTVGGSNNAISFDASGHEGTVLIQDASGNMLVEEDASGAIWFSSASFSIKNGVVTLGFANGNVVTISDVRSSGPGDLGAADGTVNQLVSAMASYSTAPGSAISTGATQTSAQPLLFASSHQ